MPPKAKFPCEAQCPEDCHNSSQFEFYNKEVWRKDKTLQITCASMSFHLILLGTLDNFVSVSMAKLNIIHFCITDE